MKNILFAIFIIGQVFIKNQIENSTWTCKIANGCFDTLTFKSNNRVIDYDCETRYTFQGSYKILKDTLLITLRDDSHSEDNGKVYYFRIKYLVKNNVLYAIGHGELSRGKWKDVRSSWDKSIPFKRIN
jgi:hypothetical protein